MLEVSKLEAGYGETVILQNISATIPRGKITALIGPNGCGKSTLLRCLSRLLPPKAGKVLVNGQDIYTLSPKAVAQQLALLPQQHIVPEGIDVRTLVGYGRSPYLKLWGNLTAQDWATVDAAMAETGITTLAYQPVSEMSGGQQQRVFLAMTLAQQTPILLLDEPTTYLDWNHQVALMKIIRARQQQGITIVVVLHDLNQAARYCDYLIVLKSGQIQAVGTPEEVLSETLLETVFSVEATVHRCPESGAVMAVIR